MDTAKPNAILHPITEKKKSAALKYKEKDVCFLFKMKDIFPFQMYFILYISKFLSKLSPSLSLFLTTVY